MSSSRKLKVKVRSSDEVGRGSDQLCDWLLLTSLRRYIGSGLGCSSSFGCDGQCVPSCVTCKGLVLVQSTEWNRGTIKVYCMESGVNELRSKFGWYVTHDPSARSLGLSHLATSTIVRVIDTAYLTYACQILEQLYLRDSKSSCKLYDALSPSHFRMFSSISASARTQRTSKARTSFASL